MKDASNITEFVDVVSRKTKSDLDRLKKFIGSQGQATGAFRGTITAPQQSRR